MSETKQKPSIGRAVHYRLPRCYGSDEHPAWRAATIVAVFDGGYCNLTVHLDAINDGAPGDVDELRRQGVAVAMHCGLALSAHVGSAQEGAEPGCWRWPPRVS